MAWSVEYNSELRIIESVYAGTVDGKELRNAAQKRIETQQEHNTNQVLVDATALESVGSMVDIFNLPALYYPSKSFSRATMIALVLPKLEQPLEATKFYVTASQNRGWNAKAFENREDALVWLGVR